MEHQSICVLLNVGAGKRDTRSQPDSVRAAFEAHGAKITLKVLDDGAQLLSETKKALAEGHSTIVAGGGDGTICTVAAVLAKTQTIMGILPLGTFNYVAHSLGLPMDIVEAAKVIVDNNAVQIRTATVNDTLFLNNASLGAYPASLEMREEVYRRWGRSQVAAYWAVVKTLLTVIRPLNLRLTVDGASRTVRTPLVFIVNNAYQLQNMALEGGDKIAVGQLAVFIAPDSSRFGMIKLAAAVAIGRAASRKNFELLGGKDVLIDVVGRSTRRKRSIAMDGERLMMQGPYRFKVVSDSLRVTVPADFDDADLADPDATNAAAPVKIR